MYIPSPLINYMHYKINMKIEKDEIIFLCFKNKKCSVFIFIKCTYILLLLLKKIIILIAGKSIS